jgi:hypothetical protein
MAGKRAAYNDGTTHIIAACTTSLSDANTEVATAALTTQGVNECYTDNGTDMIIWTKHLTDFAAYTENTSGGGTHVGGGSSSGGSSSGTYTLPITQPETPTTEPPIYNPYTEPYTGPTNQEPETEPINQQPNQEPTYDQQPNNTAVLQESLKILKVAEH